jgi:D-alanyl-D-alanine carboxypeptidase
MLRIRTGAPRGLRWGVFGFASVVAVLTLSSDPAAAAPYAAIVVDGNSGAVLHSSNPDAQRHPASLTKIMTLYLLFEQLEAGRLKLDSQLKVSEHAASQSPTKLGLRAGSTIAVEDAIKGIITRSANDASVVVAEAIAGDEDDFAKLMTRKARALGMSRTVYKNASGLPDDNQVTTARDQSTLGRAIQERFPRYYKYFSTRSFSFRGQWIANHNRLLGRVEGVDGIKTGYIRASGFNLVTSVNRGNRYLIAVVMGGSSARSRDARMRELISEQIAHASTKRTAPMVAGADRPEAKAEPNVAARAEPKPESKVAAKPEPKAAAKPEPRYAVASATNVPVRFEPAPKAEPAAAAASATSPVATGSTEPIRPVLVKTLTVRAGPQTASLAPTQMAAPAAPAPAGQTTPPAKAEAPARAEAPAQAEPAARPETMPARPAGARPGVFSASLARTAAAPVVETAPGPAPAPAPAIVAAPAPAIVAATSAPAPAPAAAPAAKPPVRSGWIIQVGAYPAEQDAKQRLSTVQSKAAKLVAGADPYTETVLKGGTTYYRARFAGFDQDKAEAACKFLKRNDVECVTVKN